MLKYLEDRIHPEPMSGCWIWSGPIIPSGYGHCRTKFGSGVAYRAVWEDLIGPIPKGLELDHLCRVRICVNPDHLEPVTTQVNSHRSNSFASKNVKKTHCPAGHAYSGYNVIKDRRNRRYCRMCRNKRSLIKYYLQKLKKLNFAVNYFEFVALTPKEYY